MWLRKGAELTIMDSITPPCPKCGGMTLLVHVPHGGEVVWCTECEECYEPEESGISERGGECE